MFRTSNYKGAKASGQMQKTKIRTCSQSAWGSCEAKAWQRTSIMAAWRYLSMLRMILMATYSLVLRSQHSRTLPKVPACHAPQGTVSTRSCLDVSRGCQHTPSPILLKILSARNQGQKIPQSLGIRVSTVKQSTPLTSRGQVLSELINIVPLLGWERTRPTRMWQLSPALQSPVLLRQSSPYRPLVKVEKVG